MFNPKTVNIAQKVESLAFGFVGVFFFSMGTSYFQERLLYRMPTILIPIFNIFGNVGLAIALMLVGGGIIYYGYTKWRSATTKRSIYLILSTIGIIIGTIWANIDLNEQEEHPYQTVIASPDDLIMDDIFWSFIGGQYALQESFIKELVQYNLEINQHTINPYEIVLKSSEVMVLFSYEDEDGEEGLDEFRLKANSGEGFTLGELLFKIHNQVVEYLEDLDDHFFEGLLNMGAHDDFPDIPFYYLYLGS